MLNKMGFKATPKILDGGVYFQTIGNAKTKAQTGFVNWFQDFPHPKNFFFLVDGKSIQPTNNQNPGNVDDPEITKGIAELNLEPEITDEVAGQWEELNRELVERGYIVPYGHRKLATFFSERMDFENCSLVPPGVLQRLLELLPQVADRWLTAPWGRALRRPPRGVVLRCGGEPVTALDGDRAGSRTRTAPGRQRWEQEAEREHVHGIGPWRLGCAACARNKVALAFGVLFVLLVLACVAAPLWANHVADTTAEREPPVRHDHDRRQEDERRRRSTACRSARMAKADGKFFLGADANGRDIMVRLLYGGRNSLMIGIAAALMTTVLSIILGLIAGYFRGWSDAVIRSVLDVIWSFPVVILGVALGVALALGGLKLGPITIAGDSLADPDPHHRRRLHALHGAADPRPGAGAAREGVRRGGARAGRGAAADHVHARCCRTWPRRCSCSSRC